MNSDISGERVIEYYTVSSPVSVTKNSSKFTTGLVNAKKHASKLSTDDARIRHKLSYSIQVPLMMFIQKRVYGSTNAEGVENI